MSNYPNYTNSVPIDEQVEPNQFYQDQLWLNEHGWILDEKWLKIVIEIYPDFFSRLRPYIERTPDATHFVFDKTSQGGESILVGVHKRLLNVFSISADKICGNSIWKFINLGAKHIPRGEVWKFIREQQERHQQARQGQSNLTDAGVPFFPPHRRKTKKSYGRFINIHSKVLYSDTQKGMIRVISLIGLEQDLDKVTFDQKLNEWEKSILHQLNEIVSIGVFSSNINKMNDLNTIGKTGDKAEFDPTESNFTDERTFQQSADRNYAAYDRLVDDDKWFSEHKDHFVAIIDGILVATAEDRNGIDLILKNMKLKSKLVLIDKAERENNIIDVQWPLR